MSKKTVFNSGLYDFLQKDKQTRHVWREHIQPEERDKYGRTNLAESNLTPKELAVSSNKLPHSQLSDQNFLSINPKLVKPSEDTQVNMTPYQKKVLTVPVLRKLEFEEKDMYVIMMAFVAPFYRQKLVNVEMTQHQVYIAYMTACPSWDQSLKAAIADKGAECGDIQFKFEYYDRRTTFMEECIKGLPEFLNINLMPRLPRKVQIRT